jgi:hypothetical protein
MEENQMNRFQRLGLAVLFSSLLSLSLPIGPDAFAEQTAIVKVSIEEVWNYGDDSVGRGEGCDGGSAYPSCDFYPKVIIGDEEFGNEDMNISNENLIHPSNWVFFSKEIPISTGSVPIKIQIWDSDSPTGDDLLMITPEYYSDSDDTYLDLSVDLSTCSVVGEFYEAGRIPFSGENNTSTCNKLLVSSGVDGTGKSANEFAQITFKVEVMQYGAKCLHFPIWPQPGEKVTIKAESKIASDSIEIWMKDKGLVHSAAGTTTSFTTPEGVTKPDFSYYCRVLNEGKVKAWTGWRTVAVGDKNGLDSAFPVFYNDIPEHSIDIVFHPAGTSYPDAYNKSFQQDVYNMIWNTFLSEDIFLRNQYIFNFWISTSIGDVHESGYPTNDECSDINKDHPPQQGPWSDLTVVLHKGFCRNNFFNSSFGNFATSGTTIDPITGKSPYGTLLHESGHGIFNLSDEYDGDGVYWENAIAPNVYTYKPRCENDAPENSVCRDIHDTRFGKTYFTSDPAHNDVMVDGGPPQTLDLRRIRWLFDRCRHFGEC